MMRKFFRLKGFTLMEVLIVVVLILLFSSVTMFSITRFTVSAEARNVIRNLQMLKAATAMWYQDNIYRLDNDNTKKNDKDVGSHIKIWNKSAKKYEIQQVQKWSGEKLGIYKYLDSPENFIINAHNPPSAGEYGITAALLNNNRWTWFVGYCFPNNFEEMLIMRLLKAEKEIIFVS